MANQINKKIKKIKRELYIETSAKYFETSGYENAKMSDLAKDLEVSVGTLYKIFESKENLYFEYILYQINQFVKKLNDNASSDPIENLKLYLQYTYEPFIEKRKSIEYTMTNDPFFFHKLNADKEHTMDGVFDFLARQFELIIKDDTVDHRHIAILFKKLSDGYAESYMIKEFDTTNVIDDTIDLFLNGILKTL